MNKLNWFDVELIAVLHGTGTAIIPLARSISTCVQ
jgi:hypothetical protein